MKQRTATVSFSIAPSSSNIHRGVSTASCKTSFLTFMSQLGKQIELKDGAMVSLTRAPSSSTWYMHFIRVKAKASLHTPKAVEK